ncbi:MAG: hypothetical protein Q4E76_00825 [Tissierellia bacterium]|nr:hypothetical protein [Tissierellia bacterium]
MKRGKRVLLVLALLMAPFLQLSVLYGGLPGFLQGALVPVGVILLNKRSHRFLYTLYGGMIFDGTIGSGGGVYLLLFLLFFLWVEWTEQWLGDGSPLEALFTAALGYGISTIVMGFALLFFNGQAALMDGGILLRRILATGLYSYLGSSHLPKRRYKGLEELRKEHEFEPLV